MEESLLIDQALTNVLNDAPKPYDLIRRIGSTVYSVKVTFNKLCADTMEDKILRIIKNEAEEKDKSSASFNFGADEIIQNKTNTRQRDLCYNKCTTNESSV